MGGRVGAGRGASSNGWRSIRDFHYHGRAWDARGPSLSRRECCSTLRPAWHVPYSTKALSRRPPLPASPIHSSCLPLTLLFLHPSHRSQDLTTASLTRRFFTIDASSGVDATGTLQALRYISKARITVAIRPDDHSRILPPVLELTYASRSPIGATWWKGGGRCVSWTANCLNHATLGQSMLTLFPTTTHPHHLSPLSLTPQPLACPAPRPSPPAGPAPRVSGAPSASWSSCSRPSSGHWRCSGSF